MIGSERLWVLALAACILVATLLVALFKLRMTPVERERRRRTRLHQLGRMGDGLLTDVSGDTLYYSYSVHGVDYATSQDISGLRDMVPTTTELLIGPVTLKYLVRNPGNSIVICEHWSGLRIRRETIRHEQVG